MNLSKQSLLPYKEKEIEKLYYSIGEVAEMFDVSTSLIRYWEGEFDTLSPKKNKKGNRLFTKEDIRNLKLIYHLVKVKGYTLDGAKNKLRTSRADEEAQLKIQEKLLKLKKFLIDLKEEL